MTQDERWDVMYTKVTDFVDAFHRRPSKHRPEERDMSNWLKYNKKRIAAGKLEYDRRLLFDQLMERISGFRRVNQYAYMDNQPEMPIDFSG